MSDKKYSVFISSTYKDLRDARQSVMRALLENNCIPAGMELFPASNQDAWSVIQKVIDECDYYIVILGQRYGSIVPDSNGMGYTEKEFHYAVKRGIPILPFFHAEPKSSLMDEKAKEEEPSKEKVALGKFRVFLREGRTPAYWETPDELFARVGTSLQKLIQDNPRPGWVRGNSALKPEIPGISGFDYVVFSAVCNSLMEEGMHGTEYIDFGDKTVKTVKSLKEEHTKEKVVGSLERLSHLGMIGKFDHYFKGKHEPVKITIKGAMAFFNHKRPKKEMDSLRVKVAKFVKNEGPQPMHGDIVYEKFNDVSPMLVDCILVEIRDAGGFKISLEHSGAGGPLTVIIHNPTAGLVDGYIAQHSVGT